MLLGDRQVMFFSCFLALRHNAHCWERRAREFRRNPWRGGHVRKTGKALAPLVGRYRRSGGRYALFTHSLHRWHCDELFSRAFRNRSWRRAHCGGRRRRLHWSAGNFRVIFFGKRKERCRVVMRTWIDRGFDWTINGRGLIRRGRRRSHHRFLLSHTIVSTQKKSVPFVTESRLGSQRSNRCRWNKRRPRDLRLRRNSGSKTALHFGGNFEVLLCGGAI